MPDKNQQYLTSTPASCYLPVDNLIDLFEETSSWVPGKVIYYYLEDGFEETSKITFGEMNHMVKAIAARLQQNFKKGDRALMLFPPGIEFIVSLFGCFYSGIIGVPAYPPRKNRLFERFESIVNDCNPSVILTTSKIREDLIKNFSEEKCLKGIDFLAYEEVDDQLARLWHKPEIKPEDLALLQYTSGSTGTPNGVMVSHGNILVNSEFINQAYGHDRNSMGVNWLPGFHDMGLIGALFQPPYLGCTNAIIPPNSFLLRPMNWLKAISKYRATTAGGPNFALDFCIERLKPEELEGIDLSTVKPFFCGAEPIRKETFERYAETFKPWNFRSVQLYPCYGMAESVLIVTGGNLNDEPVYFTADSRAIEKGLVIPAEEGTPFAKTFVSCGFPWVGTKVAIVDPQAKTICQNGRVGEIWTGGPSVAQGYWNKPNETEETFRAYLSDTGEGPFLRTGDLGFMHNGHLYISGRIKDLIIIRGLNHYPHDLERTAENCHEALQPGSVAAFSVDAANEERLVIVAEIKRTHLRALKAEEVFEAIRREIAEIHQLQVYAITLIRTGILPKTSSGKIQRFACRRDFLTGNLEKITGWNLNLTELHAIGPMLIAETDIHEWIRQWMAKELKIDPAIIEIDKPITSYGLDSLKAVLLSRDAEEHFGVEWPLDLFLEETTIEQIARKGKELLKSFEF